MFLWKFQRFETENVSTRGNSNPPNRGFMPNALTIELSGSDIFCPIFCPMFSNTGSGGIDNFEVNLTFEILTVRGQQHSFSTQCQVSRFFRQQMSRTEGTRTTNPSSVGWILKTTGLDLEKLNPQNIILWCNTIWNCGIITVFLKSTHVDQP